MKIFNWILGHKVDIKHQLEMAEKLHNDDPVLAMRIAMGEEKSPNGILSATVYAKVCDEVEKIQNIDTSTQLANTDNNSKISIEARRLKLRSSDSPIEIMKDIRMARIKNLEKNLPAGETFKSTKKKMVEELKKDLEFLQIYVKYFLSTQEKIKDDIKKIKSKTEQNLKDEQIIKDLWILRYIFLHLWFLGTKKPTNQNELEAYISLIERAFQSFKETSGYLIWLKNGFIEYTGTDQPRFSDLKNFELRALEKVSEKIPLIAFECTDGRLGGELHNFVIKLLMITIEKDKKTFFDDGDNLTEEENRNVKKVIKDMSEDRKKLAEDFINSLGEDGEKE